MMSQRRGCLAALVAVSLACGGSGAPTDPPGPVATTLAVTPASTGLTIGQGSQFSAIVRDQHGAQMFVPTIAWSTSDAAVATVSSSGYVVAIAAGAATVTASHAGLSASAAVTVSSSGDVVVADAAWSQGVQRDGNGGAFPMVVGGGPAVVNVVLRAQSAMPAASSQLLLRLTNAAGSVLYADTLPVATPTTSASLAEPSAQFLVPAAQLQAGVRWQVVRDPRGVVPDGNPANDVFPAAAPAELSTMAVAPLRVRFVPIVLAAHGGVTGNVNASNIEGYLQTVRSVHPLGELEATVGPPVVTSQSFGSPPSGGQSSFWIPLLGELDLARVADPSAPDQYWYGVVRPPNGFTFTAFGGFGYIPADPHATGPGTRTSLGVQTGWFTRPTQARDIVAHELAHNMGRRHSPCGGAGAPLDPTFPVVDGTSGAYGHDVLAWATGAAVGAAPIPSTQGDVMGYCFPVWAHPYTYEALLAARAAPAAAVAVRLVPSARRRVLVVRGVLEAERVVWAPVFALTGRPTEDAGPLLVQALDASGAVIAARRVQPAQVDHANASLFTAAIPLDAADEQRLAAVRVTGPGLAPAVHRVARSSGAVPPRWERSALRTTVFCGDRAAAGIALFDDLTGTLIGSTRGAQLVVPRRLAAVRVACSDGVRTREAVLR